MIQVWFFEACGVEDLLKAGCKIPTQKWQVHHPITMWTLHQAGPSILISFPTQIWKRLATASHRVWAPHGIGWNSHSSASPKNDACSSVQDIQSTISFSHNEAKTSESALDYTILPARTLLLVHFPVHRQDSGRCTPVACTTRALMANVLILHDRKWDMVDDKKIHQHPTSWVG